MATSYYSSYQNTEDPSAGHFQHAYSTEDAFWVWLEKRPEKLARFNTFIEGVRGNRQHWVDWFPLQEQVLNDASESHTSLYWLIWAEVVVTI
jgi:hypothetical protein